MKNSITAPLGIAVAAVTSLAANLLLHYLVFGNDPYGHFAFRFFGNPLIVFLSALIPSAGFLTFRVIKSRTEVTLNPRRTYAWMCSVVVVLNIVAPISFTGIDSYGFWMLELVANAVVGSIISVSIGLLILAKTKWIVRLMNKSSGPVQGA
ncbi:hypothetical protein G7068_05525 [Leucobacter viscericola]|uniref:Uncharacterized protein n=1 Tax=Leucobacter viscericola TaxID=2714935 RepID=A0A6G7XDQ5_9MICO|nr:hypothetical protein [Leucobacter viscericola]QIK62724.1 hypothetical protein G7068_05525 [Leucobacter viscericola]